MRSPKFSQRLLVSPGPYPELKRGLPPNSLRSGHVLTRGDYTGEAGGVKIAKPESKYYDETGEREEGEAGTGRERRRAGFAHGARRGGRLQSRGRTGGRGNMGPTSSGRGGEGGPPPARLFETIHI